MVVYSFLLIITLIYSLKNLIKFSKYLNEIQKKEILESKWFPHL
jgi:hypothetical protein